MATHPAWCEAYGKGEVQAVEDGAAGDVGGDKACRRAQVATCFDQIAPGGRHGCCMAAPGSRAAWLHPGHVLHPVHVLHGCTRVTSCTRVTCCMAAPGSAHVCDSVLVRRADGYCLCVCVFTIRPHDMCGPEEAGASLPHVHNPTPLAIRAPSLSQ
eukprot:4352851-Prymnesium_polylepis.1